jgi:hypothetical protein
VSGAYDALCVVPSAPLVIFHPLCGAGCSWPQSDSEQSAEADGRHTGCNSTLRGVQTCASPVAAVTLTLGPLRLLCGSARPAVETDSCPSGGVRRPLSQEGAEGH